MKKSFLGSVVLLVSLMALGASGAWAENIPLANPGFELGPSQNDTIPWNQWLDPAPGPSKWWIYYGGAGVLDWGSAGKAVRMGWGGATCIVRQFVGSAYPVEANTTYTVSAMVKKAAGAGSGYMRLGFHSHAEDENGSNAYFDGPQFFAGDTYQRYYFSVSSTDHPEIVGRYISVWLCTDASEWTNYQDWDDVQLTAVPSPISIGEVKKKADKAQVYVEAATVTAVRSIVVSGVTYPVAFYIQDASGGIRVECDPNYQAVGDKVNVSGTMATNSQGERCIYTGASNVVKTGTGSVEPLGMNNNALGGGDFHYTYSPSNLLPLQNPGFELGPTVPMGAWNTGGGNGRLLDPSPGPSSWWHGFGGAGVFAYSEGQYLQLGWGGAGSWVRQMLGPYWPVLPNTTYTLSASARKSAATGDGMMRFLFTKSPFSTDGGAWPSDMVNSQYRVECSSTDWQSYSFSWNSASYPDVVADPWDGSPSYISVELMTDGSDSWNNYQDWDNVQVTAVGPMQIITGPGQRGVDGSSGLNNVGILVRTSGLIENYDTENRTLTIDDGSGLNIRCSYPEGVDPSLYSYCSVTGVCSIYRDGNVLKPVVLLRTADDFVGIE